MDSLFEIAELARSHPRASAAVLAGIAVAYWLAQRKSRLFREADADFHRLRGDRDTKYTKTRPLR